MVNTGGSYNTKYWYKSLIPMKENLFVFTKEQHSLIFGSLLGDGTMRMGKGSKNANFKVEQGLDQKEYVFWKYHILKNFVITKPNVSYRYKVDGTRYAKSWWFRTIRHPLLTRIYKLFYLGDGYRTGRKIIPKQLKNNLDPMAVAIWIMDDGSYNKECIDISTYSFSIDEVEYLIETMRKKFSVYMKYYKDRDKGYRMYASKTETEKIVGIIKPYIISSMRYKIGL